MRERALPDDDRVYELDGEVRGLGCVGTATERVERPAAFEAFGDRACDVRGFACEKSAR